MKKTKKNKDKCVKCDKEAYYTVKDGRKKLPMCRFHAEQYYKKLIYA